MSEPVQNAAVLEKSTQSAVLNVEEQRQSKRKSAILLLFLLELTTVRRSLSGARAIRAKMEALTETCM